MIIAQRLFSRQLNRVLLSSIFLASLFTGPVLAGLGGSIDDEEPLMPDQAFALSAEVINANMVRAEWEIADKYYLYRDKFKFTSNTAGITTGEAQYPKGKIKEDEFFGAVETYRGHIAIDIPLIRSGDADTLELTVVSQGCADMGICYPPQTQTISLRLPPVVTAASPAAPTADKGFNPLAALKNLSDSLGFTDSGDDFLTPEQAFSWSVEARDGNTLRAHWDIADGVYLYRDKFAFELQDANGVTLGKPVLPEGDKKVDESFGEMIVYHGAVDIDIPLIRSNFAATDVTLIAKYQGCADAGFCYPPITDSMPVSLPATSAATTAPATGDDGPISEQDRIADTLAGDSNLLTILTFFGFGLLLAFTPCVFPMIPILSSIIAGQGENLTTRKAFIMSLVYVLAMALTYTAAGVFAGLGGANLQAAFQNPWVLGSFSAVFVALSLSMFGFFELQMPSFLQSRLTDVSNRQKGGTLVGVGIMGFLSALIVGPCVAAPLAGALIYIGQTGDAVLGGVALFALSMGMGAPLLLIGASAGKILPRAGSWMDTIKAVFGVTMLAVAIWMLERILPTAITMTLWATLAIVSAIYMGALEPYGKDATGWPKLWKGLGMVLLIYGALLLVGVASGSRDMLQPLHGAGFSGSATTGPVHTRELAFKRIKGLNALNREIASASASGKGVMLDFYADWCVSCKEMEKYTFGNAGVQQALKNVVLLQADVTANDDEDRALLKKYGLIGPPSILFFGTDGTERRRHRVVGFMKAEEFRSHVQNAIN
ncbi:MAG: protein-disulfide reductase DsbD [Gammaproteobacteria bacterium]|nr:protein-disulfide reductase DsbD [Gammaproteobacteria bacterium]